MWMADWFYLPFEFENFPKQKLFQSTIKEQVEILNRDLKFRLYWNKFK